MSARLNRIFSFFFFLTRPDFIFELIKSQIDPPNQTGSQSYDFDPTTFPSEIKWYYHNKPKKKKKNFITSSRKQYTCCEGRDRTSKPLEDSYALNTIISKFQSFLQNNFHWEMQLTWWSSILASMRSKGSDCHPQAIYASLLTKRKKKNSSREKINRCPSTLVIQNFMKWRHNWREWKHIMALDIIWINKLKMN